jgi:hypothetical protein
MVSVGLLAEAPMPIPFMIIFASAIIHPQVLLTSLTTVHIQGSLITA